MPTPRSGSEPGGAPPSESIQGGHTELSESQNSFRAASLHGMFISSVNLTMKPVPCREIDIQFQFHDAPPGMDPEVPDAGLYRQLPLAARVPPALDAKGFAA